MNRLRARLIAGIAVLTILALPLESASAAGASEDDARFVQIEAGDYASTALRADGTVWTWGRRTMIGELGVADMHVSSRVQAPVRAKGLTDIVSISSSGSGTQAGLRSDGTVWQWGDLAALEGESSFPEQVPGLTDVSLIAAVVGGGFALKKDGTLWNWELLGGDSEQRFRVTQVPGSYKWKSMASSGFVAVALEGNGAIWALGMVGQRGTKEIVPPARLAAFPALKQADVTGERILGVDAGGTAWIGQLDSGTLYSSGVARAAKLTGKPVKVRMQLKAAELEAGLLLTAGGEVWTLDKWLTGKVGKLKGLTGIRSISVGYHHALAIDSSGKLWGFGGNQWNEAGVPRTSSDGMVYAPVRVQPAVGVTVNGQPLATAYPAVMTNGYVFVPLRDTVKALGGTVTVSADYKITIAIEGKTAVIDAAGTTVDGRPVQLPIRVFSNSGATLVPAALLKLLGANAAWDSRLGELTLSIK